MFKTGVVQENVSSIKSNYDIARRWKQKGNRLFFKTNEEEYYFEMPIGWDISDTHEDLFRISHHFLCSPWETGILDGWTPSRTKGWRPGLAFSGGVDSTACMHLMPPETLLFYHQRDGFESNLNHTNAFRFIGKLREDGKQVVLARGKKPIARMVPCFQLPNDNRPEVGTVTSKPIKIVEKREVAGRIGDTVVYF